MRESWSCVKEGCPVVCSSHKALHRHVDQHVQEALANYAPGKYETPSKAAKAHPRSSTRGADKRKKQQAHSVQQSKRPLLLAKGKVNKQRQPPSVNAEMIDLRTPSLSPDPESTASSPQLITPQHGSDSSRPKVNPGASSPVSPSTSNSTAKSTAPTWVTRTPTPMPTDHARGRQQLGSPIHLPNTDSHPEGEYQTNSMDGDVSDDTDFEMEEEGDGGAGPALLEVDDLEPTTGDKMLRPASPLHKLSAGLSTRTVCPAFTAPLPTFGNPICSSLIDRPITLSPSPSETSERPDLAVNPSARAAAAAIERQAAREINTTTAAESAPGAVASSEPTVTEQHQLMQVFDTREGSSRDGANREQRPGLHGPQTVPGRCGHCACCVKVWQFIADCATAALADMDPPTIGHSGIATPNNRKDHTRV